MSSTKEIMRKSGMCGASVSRLRLVPNMVNGSSKQAGQSSVTAPRAPAIALARRVPTGQVPCFLRHAKSPIFRAKSRMSSAVKSISPCVGNGRGGLQIHAAQYPNSHVKKIPRTRVVLQKEIQNDLLCRKGSGMSRV